MPSTRDPDNGFVEWLSAQLAQKRWNPADLAQAADVYPSVISGLMTREKGLGVDTAKKLAAALGVSQYELFHIAGLIDEEIYDNEKASREYLRLLAAIDDNNARQEAIDTIETILRRVAERRRAADSKPSNNPSVAKGKA